MTQKFLLNLFISISASFLLVNCASVPMASNENDVVAKKFEVPANKSRIYVYRNEALGSALKFTLAIPQVICARLSDCVISLGATTS